MITAKLYSNNCWIVAQFPMTAVSPPSPRVFVQSAQILKGWRYQQHVLLSIAHSSVKESTHNYTLGTETRHTSVTKTLKRSVRSGWVYELIVLNRQDETSGSRWVSSLQLNSVTEVQKFSQKKLEAQVPNSRRLKCGMNPPTNLQSLWASLFSDAFYSVNVKWYTFLFVRQENKTSNVTLRSVPVTSVAVEKQWVLHIVSVCLCSCLSYPASQGHLFCTASYFHLWPVWLYHILPHYLINGTIFDKKFNFLF